MKKYIILINGAGDGCDYTIGCNKQWKIVTVNNESSELKEQELKDKVIELYDCYGGIEMIDSMLIYELIDKQPIKLSALDIEEFIPKKEPEKTRGCEHEETENPFCAQCGQPMWIER